MAREPDPGIAAEIGTRLGTEPVIIVEVDWAGTYSYADKTLTAIPGQILSLSGLDAIIKIGSGGSSGSISVTLDDSDGDIKDILNANDIHKRPARVYQSYEGLSGLPLLLFSGQVSSPIIWNEGARTIAFTIVNIIEDEELGFAPEDGEFDFVSENAIGVPWPLCFGDVVRVPATRVTEALRGTSLTRYGQITLPELEQLCGLAVTAQQAETAKDIADLMPGYSDTNYSIVMDNLTSATIGLNNYLDSLISDSPTQEENLKTYIGICKELERWRVFSEQEFTKLIQAEEDKIPLESHPGKPLLSAIKPWRPEMDKNPKIPETTITITKDVIEGFRLNKEIPEFDVVVRPGIPATVGLAEQAQIAYDAYRAANYPYSSPEEWDQALILQEIVNDAQAALLDAQGRAVSATSNVQLALSNTRILNTEKTALEKVLLAIVLTHINVENGEKFPQGSEVEIIINGMHFKGIFTGRVFAITQANTPADVSVLITTGEDPNEFLLDDTGLQLKGKYCLTQHGIVFVENQDLGRCYISPILYQKTGTIGDPGFDHDIYNFRYLSGTIQQTSVFLSIEWLELLRQQDVPDYANGLSNLRQRDYAIEIGDTVYLASNYSELYVANLIPSTVIHEVMAYRNLDGVRRLVPVPSRYYTINLDEAIAGQNSTTIRFRRPLTEYYSEEWEDTIYVSLTSSVGPNTADIIEHLATTYTDLIIDSGSFAVVNGAIDPFPSNFALLERRGTLGAIEEIAWQARCAAYVRDQTLFLKYLAVEDAAVESINESIVDRRTLELSMTKTEDLITVFYAEWDSDYSAEKRNRIVLRNNVAIYGTVEEEYDFFIYNIQSLVVKAATFWLIRYSNTWKIANFKTPINMLRLETLDTVEIDFGQEWIANSAVKGIVDEVVYNSESQELEFAVQTSVRSGFLEPYIFTWPAGVSVGILYPTDDDPYAGG